MIDREGVRRLRTLGVRLVFGDRIGLVLFLASLCLFGLLWRTAFLINDSYTLANGLYAMADGDLSMTEGVYGTLRSPGATLSRGDIYPRNYGVLVLSLPFVPALRLLDAVADFRIALVGGWSLLLFATIVTTGRVLDRSRQFTLAGGALVVVLFTVNVALATPLDDVPYHLLALQLFHLLVSALLVVLAYRLVASRSGSRLGVLGAVVTLLGTPLAFWATVPKRHVITAAVVLALALVLASRRTDGDWSFEVRAIGYGLVAVLAWIHAPEALVVFVTFGVVDFLTATDRRPRTTVTLGALFLVALVPLFVTNVLVSGDPFTVPRMQSNVGAVADVSLADGSGSGSPDGGSTAGRSGPLFAVLAVAGSALAPFTQLFELAREGVTVFVDRPDAVYHTFVRSGFVDRISNLSTETASANLTILESAPVLAGLAAVVPAVFSSCRDAFTERRLPRVVAPADAFLLLFTVTFTLIYLSSLPLHAQVTVRYLFPITPALVVLLVRLPTIRRALERHWKTVVWTTGAGILIGGQFVLVALVALDVGRPEAFQFHAVLGLAVAALLAVWSLVGHVDDRLDRIGAILLGLATAATTIFVCFAAVEYYGLGQSHALPMIRVVAELLPLQ